MFESDRKNHGLRSTWPLTRSHWIRIAIALAVVVLLGVVIGFALTDWAAPNFITRTDRDIAQRLADGRTPRGDQLAHWGAFIADTPVKIGITAAVVAAMVWRWRRWHEAVFVALTLIFEATAFITITAIVQRPRPDVPRLLDSPVNSSFPSGHVAAATVYGTFFVVLLWHSRSTIAPLVALALVIAAPIIVGWARMYQGMHFLSDVVAGVVLGLVSLVIVYQIVGSPVPQHARPTDGDVEHHD